MIELTAIIITKNKKRVKDSLQSIKFADEVLVEEYPNLKNYSYARNKSLIKAKGKWVLFVDDDEIIPKSLQREIRTAIKNESYEGFFIKREDHFLGRTLRHGETNAVKLLRLAKRSAGQFERPVHEFWFIEGRTGVLKTPIIHTPHKSISSFLKKINRYSSLDAKYRHEKKMKSSLFKIIFYPPGKFIRNYIFKLGFLDGTPGTIMAFMMSFHSFQTWTKLYLLQNKK